MPCAVEAIGMGFQADVKAVEQYLQTYLRQSEVVFDDQQAKFQSTADHSESTSHYPTNYAQTADRRTSWTA